MAKSHLALSDEHFRAIGRIVAHCEALHMQMQFMVWALIGAPQRIGQIVTGGTPFKGTVRVLGALVVDRLRSHSSLAGEFDQMLRCAEAVEEQRNTVVHSIWGGGGDSPQRIKMRVTRKGGLVWDDAKCFRPEDLDAIADQTSELAAQLIRWLCMHATELGIQVGHVSADSPRQEPLE